MTCSQSSLLERATLTLMGVDGAMKIPDKREVDFPPYTGLLVGKSAQQLGRGIFRPFVNGMAATGMDDVQAFAERVVAEDVNIFELPEQPEEVVQGLMTRITDAALARLDEAISLRAINRSTLEEIERTQEKRQLQPDWPLLYLIVATGNIRDDARQARVAVREGASIIAVIRHSAQSKLDYLPIGELGNANGGTYATRANMRYLRDELDDVGQEIGRYVLQTNYASGLAMPELAAVAVQERLDMLLCDCMYGVIFRGINPFRTFVDQHYSRMLCAYAGITINTGEDNYLTNADAVQHAHTVYASDLINEALAFQSHLPQHLMGLGHAYEIDPKIPNSHLMQLGEALLSRAIFPDHPLKYMPPTKFIKKDMFFAHAHHVKYNETAWLTGQTILLLGIMSEGCRNPHLEERLDALRNAKYVFTASRDLADYLNVHGPAVEGRANEVLGKVVTFLEGIERRGMLEAIEDGQFAATKRSRYGGKGHEGVIRKEPGYENPIFDEIERRLLA